MIGNEHLVFGIIGVVSLLIGYFTYFLSKYIEEMKAQTDNIKYEKKRKLFENAIKDLDDIIIKSLISMQKANKQGEEISENVLKIVYKNLPENTKTILDENVFDLKKYIKGSIELKIYEMKNI